MKILLLGLAIALPLWSQSEAELRRVYDAYNTALRGQYYNAIMAVLTQEQIDVYKTLPPEQRPMFFGMTSRIPISYEVTYLKPSKDGTKATMLIVGAFPATPPARAKAEMILRFAKQKGLWRMDRPVYGDDPDLRPKPKDLSMGTRSDYADVTELGGPVLRMEKQKSGTVYVIRRVEEKVAEEDAVFVPEALVSTEFVPGAVISFKAAKHKSDKLKYWAESATYIE